MHIKRLHILLSLIVVCGCGSDSSNRDTDADADATVECTRGDQCESGVCNDDNTCGPIPSCTVGATGDAQCAEIDEARPHCFDERCVECTRPAHCTDAIATICGVDNTCRGCQGGTECPSGVCNVATAECVDSAAILYVSASGGGDVCTQADPCGTINEALALVSGSKTAIRVAAGQYAEQLAIAANVAITGGGGVTLAAQIADPTDSVLRVTGSNTVSIDGFVITRAEADGANLVSCSGGANLTIANSTVTAASDTAIVGDGCSLTVAGSTLSASEGDHFFGGVGAGVYVQNGSLNLTGSSVGDNIGGGVLIENSDFSITNNFIYDNGTNLGRVSGVLIRDNDGKNEKLEFNTIVNNDVGLGAGGQVACFGSNLAASNNILMLTRGNNKQLVSGDCTHSYTLFDVDADDAPPAGQNNIAAHANFISTGFAPDHHLLSGSPGINSADPASMVSTDFDGQARPLGGRRDMGADEVE